MPLRIVFIFFNCLLPFLKPILPFAETGKQVVESSHNPGSAPGSDTGFLPDSNYQFPAVGTLSKTPITAVPTFLNISLYWKPLGGASDLEALVRYRIKGTVNWSQAQSLWFDDRIPDSIGNNIERSKEYRGSIVNLHSGTVYEIEVFLKGVNQVAR